MSDQHDDLIAELRALGGHLAMAEPADQRAAVRARLTRKAPARRWRTWTAVAVAAAAGAVGVIAPARAAVVDAVSGLLRVAGIEVHTGSRGSGPLPSRPAPLPSARPAALDDARRAVAFPVRVPAALGAPEDVTLADGNRVVTLVYRGGAVRFDQFDGTLDPVFLKQAPAAEWVRIGTDTGIWLPGPHTLTYVGRDGVERTATARLAGPTLIWSAGPVTYRLEGLATLPEAMEVARSVA